MAECLRIDMSYTDPYTLEDMVEMLLDGTSCEWIVLNERGPAGGWPEIGIIGSRIELDAVSARYNGEMCVEYAIWARNFDESKLRLTSMTVSTEPQAREIIQHLLSPPTVVAAAEYRWREIGPWHDPVSIKL